MDGTLVVECLRATSTDTTDLREERWAVALDQRAFGPRRLVVAVSLEDGTLLGLAHTRRTEPAVLALAACIDVFGASGCAAIAFCDERVVEGPPPVGLAERFAEARAVATEHGVRLVDWFSCDDLLIRSSRIAVEPGGDGWNDPS